jgi:hypothetical protein
MKKEKVPVENDNLIYENLLNIDHEMLVSKMLDEAEMNPAITLVEFLKKFDYND